MLLIIVGYVMRPVGELTPTPVGTRFPTARPGYNATQVDEAFERLHSLSRDDIERLRFRKVAAGYEMDAVDAALDAAAQSRFM
jgi:DivIVA domain-containing protein